MALSATSKPNHAMDEWVEGLVAMGFCLGCVYVGMAISEHPSMAGVIVVATITAYAPLAVWLTKRRRARGITRLF